MTGDMWHVTHYMWHVKCDMFWVVNILSYFSSLALAAWERQCFEDWEEKDQWLAEPNNDDGACRTAPAPAGLLTT